MSAKSGFTLLEVLTAVSILAVGILAVASMQVSAIQENSFSNETTVCTYLAQAKLEELKSVADVADLTDGSESGLDATGAAGGSFDRFWTVRPGPTASTRLLEVNVSWTAAGRTHSVVLRALTRGNGE
ncbi:MAG: prepilin-type N-terminal cleavage/methylation domain-containing protein [Deltaproteobacteria bacterium]|nr:prepilin-type N-terminal cleavage/methylation domain-containing protein [Deltaproteobacteria bacterium]MBW2070409.1 prepilin-type N-terminal cleavage/methylation domain-containing protein [Deltaproteobacteria bacterium]